MRVFVAGASGAIGQPLIAELIRKGHTVTGMTQTETGAARLRSQGAEAAIVNALDAAGLEAALRKSDSEMVIDELTSLPKDPAEIPKAAPADANLRLAGGGNLHRAAQACGVRRYLQQSTGFFVKAGEGLADESEGLAIDASPGIAASAKTYTTLETRVLNSPVEGVALRYGFFYGPNTWYHPDGASAEQVRQRQIPLIGKGQGVWSWVHVEDAAIATVAAMTAEPGIYNIVDSDPSPMHVWLPKFAAFVGAPPPPHVWEAVAATMAGPDPVYYQTKLRGCSNAKARAALGFNPRRLEWL